MSKPSEPALFSVFAVGVVRDFRFVIIVVLATIVIVLLAS
jgi:hypothetical protein